MFGRRPYPCAISIAFSLSLCLCSTCYELLYACVWHLYVRTMWMQTARISHVETARALGVQGSGAHGQPMSPSRPVIKTALTISRARQLVWSARGGGATFHTFDVCADYACAMYARCMCGMYVRCVCGYKSSLNSKIHTLITKSIIE